MAVLHDSLHDPCVCQEFPTTPFVLENATKDLEAGSDVTCLQALQLQDAGKHLKPRLKRSLPILSTRSFLARNFRHRLLQDHRLLPQQSRRQGVVRVNDQFLASGKSVSSKAMPGGTHLCFVIIEPVRLIFSGLACPDVHGDVHSLVAKS